MSRVVVVGSLNMDMTVRTARAPEPGETLLGDAFVRVPGGKGANQAVAAARQGASVALVGCVGDDAFGEEIAGVLRAEGIDVDGLVRDAAVPTGVAQIVVDHTGQNAIVVVPSANDALSPERLPPLDRLLAGTDVVLAQLEVPLETVRVVLRRARAAGIVTVLNAAPVRPVDDAVLALSDVCVVNEIEAAALTGLGVDGMAAAEAAGRALLARGPLAAVVTLGALGALYVDADGVIELPPFAVPAVDSVGCGDAFCGTLAAALAAGRPRDEALWRASAAGALAVTVAGATSSLPTAAAVDQLLEGERPWARSR